MGALVGKKYGSLTVMNDELYIEYKSGKCRKGVFICDCGCIKEIRFSSVASGMTTSCGCARSAMVSNKNRKHGLSKHPLYLKWLSMKDRCYNKKCISYKNYGGRGIKVCDKWKNSFIEFYDWSIKNGFLENLTIDRIDVNGDYSEINCRYIQINEQSLNKRNNFFIFFNGEKKTLSQWSKISGNSSAMIRNKINTGFDVEYSIFSKEKHNIGESHYNYGKHANNSKKVFNNITGEIYGSKREAAIKIQKSLWYVDKHIKDDGFYLKEM
jgi:hypothetical protein